MILTDNTSINGICYDWQSIRFSWGDGSPVENAEIVQISKINYGETRDSQKNYGAGSYPVSKGFGNVDVKASITLAMAEVRKLINAAKNRKIQNLSTFEIMIEYKVGNRDTAIVTDFIQGCSIDSTYFELNQNDMNVEVEMDLNPMNIKYGLALESI